MADANARTERATAQAQRYWRQLFGDDELLLSVPGMGPVTACIVRGFLADATMFATAKAAASYVGFAAAARPLPADTYAEAKKRLDAVATER